MNFVHFERAEKGLAQTHLRENKHAQAQPRAQRTVERLCRQCSSTSHFKKPTLLSSVVCASFTPMTCRENAIEQSRAKQGDSTNCSGEAFQSAPVLFDPMESVAPIFKTLDAASNRVRTEQTEDTTSCWIAFLHPQNVPQSSPRSPPKRDTISTLRHVRVLPVAFLTAVR